ncbi:MAG TPA: tail fiber domain-containing protein, partial [Candidatus Acidoferrum sp.]|nr:tail fiber domain-containing protein [Candidatus Acidoferrum sp.]
IHILIGIICIGLLPTARAVVPPPDGGYPNFTTAEGQKALFSLTSGAANTAVGWSALSTNAAGSFNTATGAGALLFNIADDNTAFGAATLLFNITGMDNTAIGAAALSNNTMGQDNTATGAFALLLNTTGNYNTANGFDALFSNTEGQFNTAFGFGALDLNSAGDSNTAIGTSAMQANTTGSNNTAIGDLALEQNTTGARNIALGVDAGIDVTSASDVICIGAPGANVDNSCYIGQIFNATSANGIPVLINSSNKLGATTSSKQFKENIKPMDRVSEALFGLKPVHFRYKKEIDPAGISQLGLVAEDVEKVNPDLVVRDKEGKAYSVRYDQVNAMLLNEFLKEHRKMEKLEGTVADLAARLQKVTARVETIQASAQVALTTQ